MRLHGTRRRTEMHSTGCSACTGTSPADEASHVSGHRRASPFSMRATNASVPGLDIDTFDRTTGRAVWQWVPSTGNLLLGIVVVLLLFLQVSPAITS